MNEKLKITSNRIEKQKRKIPKEGYVNVEWFFDNITNQCNYCGCGFHTIIKGGKYNNKPNSPKG